MFSLEMIATMNRKAARKAKLARNWRAARKAARENETPAAKEARLSAFERDQKPVKPVTPLSAEAQAYWDDCDGLPFNLHSEED